MFYFLPSWYQTGRKWYTEAPLWFRVFERMVFDDTVNQLKIFDYAGEPSCILLLNYQPNFRYFLHKEDLLSLSYWSFFDDIQNIHLSSFETINFKHLNWPEGTNFIYTPFYVIAEQDGRHLADVHFGENGNLIHVTFVSEKVRERQYIFDDRGFLSSILFFEEGRESHQDYLNSQGVWQVREVFDVPSSYIEVNPVADTFFKKSFYSSWEELIQERLESFRDQFVLDDDKLIVASHSQHNVLATEIFERQDKVFSFFENRVIEKNQNLAWVLNQSKLLVVDGTKTEEVLRGALEGSLLEEQVLYKVTPFDTRLRLGNSQSIKELIIYFLVDGLSPERYQMILEQLLKEMESNPLIVLKLVSYENHRSKETWEKEILTLIKNNYSLERFAGTSLFDGENQLEEESEVKLTAVSIHVFTNENQIIAALDTARLVVDLSSVPNLYTQIASISAGIPQINQSESDYVTHKENGWVLDEENSLEEAIKYYFDGLSNWNKALVAAVQKMTDYTSGRLVEQWKALLEK